MAAEEREPAGGRDAGCRPSRRRGRLPIADLDGSGDGGHLFDLALAFAEAAYAPGRGGAGQDRDVPGQVAEAIEHRHFVRVEIHAAGL